MKVYFLAENTSCDSNIGCEHGLSLFIEATNKKILFDMGQSGLFLENAEKLGIDLSKADLAILSHAHYDHGGGLEHFFEINKTAPVYLSRNCFMKCYSQNSKYIGLNQKILELNNKRLVFVDNRVKIDEGIYLCNYNDMEREYPSQNDGLTVFENGTHTTDEFLHEQYLTVNENGRKTVFSSCSHKGITNIAKWAEADIMIGGFHFSKIALDESGKAFLDEAAFKLKSLKTTYYTCHCTGEEQYAYMKKIMGDSLNYSSGGQSIII